MDGFEAVAVGWGRSKALFAGWDALFRNRLMGDKPSRAFQAASTHGEDAGGQLISKGQQALPHRCDEQPQGSESTADVS